MRTVLLGLGLLALAVFVAGCGERVSAGDPPYTPPPGSPLLDRTFLSTSVTENGKPRELVAGTRVRLQFMTDGRLIADAGCSNMQGQVRLEGGQLRLDELGATGIGCDRPRHDQDAWLSGILSATPSWRLDGDTLVITSGGTELVLLNREAAEPDLSLEGMTWKVETLVDGQVASSTPAGQVGTLRFEKGTITIVTPCNSGSADYQVSGSTIRVGKSIMTLRACSGDLMTLENAIMAVLKDEVRFTIDADRLTLEHPSGKGLHLRGSR